MLPENPGLAKYRKGWVLLEVLSLILSALLGKWRGERGGGHSGDLGGCCGTAGSAAAISHHVSLLFLHTSTKPFLVESQKKKKKKPQYLGKQFIYFVFTLPTKLKPQSTPLKSTPLNTYARDQTKSLPRHPKGAANSSCISRGHRALVKSISSSRRAR